MRLIDADALKGAFMEELFVKSGKSVQDIIDDAPTIEPSKSRPYGNCAECIHIYGTLGCCSTVNNEWVYDCDNGMAQYKIDTAEPSGDLVSRQLLLGAIEKCGEEKIYPQALIQTINALPSAEPKWITDRKPKEDGEYIVTLDAFGHHRFIVLMHYGKPLMPNREVKGWCWYMSDSEWGDVVYDDEDILAWLSLPTPYGESEVEE